MHSAKTGADVSGYFEGTDRGQTTLFLYRLEGWVDRDNPSAWSTFSCTRSFFQSLVLVVRLRH
jgi:hypothetical protein